MSREQQITDFFNAYADRFNKALSGQPPDIEGTVNAFAACFVEASPQGISCGMNDAQFRARIPQGFEFYKSTGTQSMEIISTAITLLDELHAMVKVHWRSTHVRKDQTKVMIEFDVYYLLQERAGALKIFAYVTGDEQKVLRENGLI